MCDFLSRTGPMRRAAMAAVAVLAAALFPAPAGAADISQGGRLYAIHCVSCHGASGISVMPGAPNFARNESLMQADVMLLNAVKRGKRAMPAYVGILNDRQILDVIAYLRTLRQ